MPDPARPDTAPHPDLSRVEAHHDRALRLAARTEDIGPFTLFVATEPAARPLHARPRPGAAVAPGAVRPEDVLRLLARQAELGVPRVLEWTAETAPALLPAVRAAVPRPSELQTCPLLLHDPHVTAAASRVRTTVLDAADPALPRALGVVSAAFAGVDVPRAKPAAEVAARARRIAAGELVVVAAPEEDHEEDHEEDGVVGAGSAVLLAEAGAVGGTAELTGIGVLPRARRRGAGAAVTASLVAEVRARGVRTVFLTAGSPAAAGVYESVGFRRRGTGHVLDAG